MDVLELLRRSSPNEGSHDLYCRCLDAASEIGRLRHALRTMLGDTEDSDHMTGFEQKQMAREALRESAGE